MIQKLYIDTLGFLKDVKNNIQYNFYNLGESYMVIAIVMLIYHTRSTITIWYLTHSLHLITTLCGISTVIIFFFG